MIGVYCGAGALIALLGHWQFDTYVAPTIAQWFILIIMGFTTHGIAYFLWDIGIKQGDFKLLSVLSYFMPVGSVLLLITFGYTQASLSLALACLLVTTGSLIACVNWRVLIGKYRRVR